MSLSRIALALGTAVQIAGCATTSSAPAGATRLPRARTSFVRFAGTGRLPPPSATVTYELCVDVAAAALVSVRAPGRAEQSEEPLANALRGWTWKVDASLPLKQGVGCWMERFAPGLADGKPTVTMETAVPLRSLRLVGDSDDLDDVGTAEPSEDVVRAMRVLDGGPLRVVLLEPRLTLKAPSPPPVAAAVVHDSDDAPCCRARPPEAPTPAPAPPAHPDGWLPQLPDLYRATHRPETAAAVYEVCTDRAGNVERIGADVPLLGANGSIVQVLKARRYPPSAAPTCGRERLSFTIE